VVLDRIDGFAQLIQHVVEQQLVFIFQRYAQTRAKTLSKAERSAIAKEASVRAVATMRGQEVVGEDGEIMNGLAAKALAAVTTMRGQEVVGEDGEIMNGLAAKALAAAATMRAKVVVGENGETMDGYEAVAQARLATQRAQVVVGADGVTRNGLEAAGLKQIATWAARDAARKATLRAALHRTPQEELEVLLPDTVAELLSGINGFAGVDGLLSFLHLYDLSVRVLVGLFPSALRSLLGGYLRIAVCSFVAWQPLQCSSGDRYSQADIARLGRVWHVGRALSQIWRSGELKTHAEALAAAKAAAKAAADQRTRKQRTISLSTADPAQFSDTKIKLVHGVSYMYQMKLYGGQSKGSRRWCVNSDRGRSGGWRATTLEADTSCFDDEHPRPFSTKRPELVQRLTTLREIAGSSRKVGATTLPSVLITQIIELEKKAADGVAGKKRKKGGKGAGMAAVAGNGKVGGKGGEVKKVKKAKKQVSSSPYNSLSAQYVKKALQRLNVSAAQVALECGMTYAHHLGNWLNGKKTSQPITRKAGDAALKWLAKREAKKP
jgi:hypothetical protein